ncbi:hypothetical protein KXW98_003047 [Aspergillus fumigatus]|jgi:hypothetical protein|uniref:Uncharacterized protein n=3 Tax=Aspergillus fumigatus TaxID=746128 RepID=Q4WZT8_ASPFU|nr:conserved hypothetical protein [Aspergillus fumigatus Af293]EDP55084.1 conserved hypothetical protein [Aspergillus fumigatus A1163]KAF4263473.1 hypothetical protein CNMCM8714_008365 [Aspergillus fumigatus]KMK61453.1 hypothetical protein Y699_02294 [Aspergillus fumigatus Z5]EAL93877.1 conserved hypothetical protein [Aspergillus fumigatus Af293]KAF4272131.1 hypothetical protein CNMCM8057_006480 [Aspergillus fumigatus]
MSTFFYGHHQQHHHQGATSHMPSSNNHHNGRSRRGPKMASQNAQRQFRGVKSMRELAEAPAVTAFRARFEAGRSFDLDDDLEFCPGLLTEDDLHSIHSASSDRSSLSSGSPDSSPLQHQIQPVQQVTPSISLSPASSNSFVHSGVNMGFQQPSAVRTRKVIPIVNPNTGMTLTSPPTSISPGAMQNAQRRW